MDKYDAAGGTGEPSNDEWLTTRQASAYVKLTKNTLDTYRSQGKGPRFHRNGRTVRYRRVDLDAYVTGEASDAAS